VIRRQVERQHTERRAAEQSARCQVVAACQAVQACGVAAIQVTRYLALSDRTVRRWRQSGDALPAVPRGRPPQCASREDRNRVYRFLKERGASTPLAAVRAAFPQLRRADLASVLRRFKRVMRRRAERHQSRLEWRRPGAVWAADFKERREPLEGRYGWILSMKDLGSGFQLAWQPLVEATAEAVCATYARLFAEHGPPLILKSDNGGQFKADATKGLLAADRVIPLYSPKRHPQYNGGVERANGQLAGYQEALAQYHHRPAGPTCDDAEGACQLANDLAHPQGWRGPTARQLWEERYPLTPQERAAFLATVEDRRVEVRAHWEFAPDAVLTHYPTSAVDRRAVRDALVAHDLLRIHPRRKRRRGQRVHAPPPASARNTAPAMSSAELPAPARDVSPISAHALVGAGTLSDTHRMIAPPTVGGAPGLGQRLLSLVHYLFRGGHSSANKSSASGQD
jgi:transposase InsO family protein